MRALSEKKNGSSYDTSQALPKSVPEPHCYYILATKKLKINLLCIWCVSI